MILILAGKNPCSCARIRCSAEIIPCFVESGICFYHDRVPPHSLSLVTSQSVRKTFGPGSIGGLTLVNARRRHPGERYSLDALRVGYLAT